MRSSALKTVRFGALTVCLMTALAPWYSVGAQVGRPGLKQPALPPDAALPDLVSLVLYVSPIRLPAAIPGDPKLPSGVQGGREAEGTVTLRANATGSGAVIALHSGNTALLRAPATVTVPTGASSVKFRYDPLPVTEPTTVTVSAVFNKQTKTDSVLILPPSIEAFTLDSLQLQGGNKTSGLVRLNAVGPSDKDIRVVLSSNNPAVQVPAEVLLRGVQQKGFQLTTKAVGQNTAVRISAALASGKLEASLTVAAARMTAFHVAVDGAAPSDCYPQGKSGSLTYSGTLRFEAVLDGPAPFEWGAAVNVTNSNPQLLPVPGKLGFGPSANRASITITCPSPAAESNVTISGSYLGETRSFSVAVKPLTLPDATVSAVLYDAAGNVVTRPTNPQPFKLCAAVAVTGDPGFTVGMTSLRYAYQHSRGFSNEIILNPFITPANPTALDCHTIEGLEIGDHVDVTLTFDPDNVVAESNENNNVHKLRVTR